MNEKKIIVVGGGAAGMLAAISAARQGARVCLVEKNEKLGKKLYITGKGRCNVTNACDKDEFLEQVCRNVKFMYSSFSAFSNYDLMTLIEEAGCELEIQRGNRVFPKTERSSDIIRALSDELKNLGVVVKLNTEVRKLRIQGNTCIGLSEPAMDADAVIIATGGLSYPSTGSTGDGMRWAENLGLKVLECRPSLVPVEAEEDYVKNMQGLSLKNVKLSVYSKDKCVYSEQGEMLFTHFGISGPLVLTASSLVGERLYKGERLRAEIDLKPALTEKELDTRILRDFSQHINKDFINSLGGLLPKKMIPVIVQLSEIPEHIAVHHITAVQRKKIVWLLKHFPFTLKGLRGFKEAVITAGGLSVRELDPKTMEVKKIKNLYFAGEVIDVDAMTGGFNLQIAFSTGYTAGFHAAGRKEDFVCK